VPMLTALFMGGPLDGQYRDVPPEPFSQPPEDERPPLRVEVGYLDGDGALAAFWYVRIVNPADSGPLWVYWPED